MPSNEKCISPSTTTRCLEYKMSSLTSVAYFLCISISIRGIDLCVASRIPRNASIGIKPRAERFLDVLSIYKFENVDCTSQEEGFVNLIGTCYLDTQCNAIGGTSIGSCADGLGVCCICEFVTVQLKRSHLFRMLISSQSRLRGENGSNDFVFSKSQLARDESKSNHLHTSRWAAGQCWADSFGFDDIWSEWIVKFDLRRIKYWETTSYWEQMQAPTDGNCVDDQFVVSGQNPNNIIPILCGINNGQHCEFWPATDQWIFSIKSISCFQCLLKSGKQPIDISFCRFWPTRELCVRLIFGCLRWAKWNRSFSKTFFNQFISVDFLASAKQLSAISRRRWRCDWIVQLRCNDGIRRTGQTKLFRK